MLTDILSSLPVRSGRSAFPNEEVFTRIRENRESGIDSSAREDMVSRFREMLATFSGKHAERLSRAGENKSPRAYSSSVGTRARAAAFSPPRASLSTTSATASRSSAASNFSSSIAMPSPSAATSTGSSEKTTISPTENPLHPVYKVPMVSQAAREAYIHFSQTTGYVWNESAADDDQGAFATTTYRVPSWGLQDFVTSDGVRHRFDVGLVYPTKGYSKWNGMDVDKIHPEVESFVLNKFKDDLAAAGIPPSMFKSITAIRVHGGTSQQSWFVDVLRIEKPNGETIYPQMNVAMRDPKHVMEIMREFVDMDPTIPS